MPHEKTGLKSKAPRNFGLGEELSGDDGPIGRDYHETPEFVDAHAAETLLRSRRSIRSFTDRPIPEEVVRNCLELALLAPNSSNLQAWEFYWVRQPEKRRALVEACLSQKAARTAAELVVCVARPDLYRRNAKLVREQLEQHQVSSKTMLAYYNKVVPLVYGTGPLSLFGFLKRPLFSLIGCFRPMVRGLYSKKDREMWAVKTSALGCENLMLAFRAHGFDTCPMEGFDEVRVRKILGLPRGARVTMVVSAGERAVGGVYGPQLRLPSELFLFET